MYRCGTIGPIHPVIIFDASDIEKAFRHMQRGDHIGKVVVRMPRDTSTIAVTPKASFLQFDEEASYIITGGFGGLGQSVLTWMIDRGARHLIVLSRSAGLREDHLEYVLEMKRRGCSVSIITGQAENEADVSSAISSAQ